jgi:hypothetical protein
VGLIVAIHEAVTSYEVTHLRNDIVAYQAAIRLTTTSGHRSSLLFMDQQPDDWLELHGAFSNVFLRIGEFDRIHHTLQSEQPTFLTVISLLGIRAFNLTTGSEPPGEGPADDEALVRFMSDVRASLPTDGPG